MTIPSHDQLSLQREASFFAEIRTHWKSLLALTLLALVYHAVLWRSWPLYVAVGGDDPKGTIGLYVDAFKSDHPAQYWNAAFRGPIPPLFHGSALSINVLVDVVGLTVLAVLAVPMVFLTVIPWGYKAAIVSASLYLLDLPMQLLYHEVSSEAFSTLFTIAAFLALRYCLQTPRTLSWALLGVAIGLGTLSRPANLGFLVLAAGILVCQIPLNRKFWLGLVTVVVALVTISPWIIYRGLRYNMWMFSRGGNFGEFFEVYDDELILPGNGPATDKLVNLLSENLLSQPGYQAAHVSLARLLRADGNPGYRTSVYSANEYVWDIVYTVDKYDGWDSSYKILSDAAYEGVQAHPWKFAQAFANGLRITFLDYAVVGPATPRNVAPPRIPGERVAWPPLYSMPYSHPNTVPEPSIIPAQIDQAQTMRLLSLLAHVQGDVPLGQSMIRFWTLLWPPLIIIYALSLVAIVTSRGKSLVFLLLSNGSAVVLTAFSSLFGNLPRYRMPVETIFLVTSVIGAAFIVGIIKQLIARNAIDKRVDEDFTG